MYYAWKKNSHTYAVYVHLEVVDDKIWVQRNYTEHEVIDGLLGAGVLPADIIAGYLPESMREAATYALQS